MDGLDINPEFSRNPLKLQNNSAKHHISWAKDKNQEECNVFQKQTTWLLCLLSQKFIHDQVKIVFELFIICPGGRS